MPKLEKKHFPTALNNFFRGRYVWVTGGAGFLGSHLCETLLGLGADVVCLDNLYTGAQVNIAHMLTSKHFYWQPYDVRQSLEPLLYRYPPPKVLFNLSCPASPKHYQKDPIYTIETSVLGMQHVLEIARRFGSIVVQASTSEVYGDPEVHPQPERYWGCVNPIGIRSCYDEGKRLAETLCFDYFRKYQVEVRVARIFNTYGPRMASGDGRVISAFMGQLLRRQPLEIYGNGLQTRSLCYVDDLIRGLLLLATKPVEQPVNLGDPHELSILAVANILLEMFAQYRVIEGAPYIFKPLPADDPKQRRPNIDYAMAHLGWKPEVTLKEGLLRTWQLLRAEPVHES